MLQIKFMFFTVVALMAVRSTVAIMGGEDAARGQFPYFVYLEAYKSPKILVIVLNIIFYHFFLISNGSLLISLQCKMKFNYRKKLTQSAVHHLFQINGFSQVLSVWMVATL